MSDDSAPSVPPAPSAHEEGLAPYAMRAALSRGRRHSEPAHSFRNPYQRDRDRIVHSTAFRRLMYKTQVLVAQTNDHHRTRLTHTLEVAQISRTIARQLGLNEDLTEAIALAHDLGHPPFGHAGETALHDCMKDHGGFEHNVHGLRIVEVREYRYPDFPGLNLSMEVLESFATHGPKGAAPELQEFLALGRPLLEAQVVDAADSLAYDAHDVDDALSIGLIDFEELEEIDFWRRARERAFAKHAQIGKLQLQPAVVRALIDWQVNDLLAQSVERLRQNRISSVEEVRHCQETLVGPGPEVQQLKAELEEFLHNKVYRHTKVMRMAVKGQRMLRALFAEFLRVPALLPGRYAERTRTEEPHRVVCDYVAGMTDRYAQEEYLRLFQPHTPL
jgi:dGTPase